MDTRIPEVRFPAALLTLLILHLACTGSPAINGHEGEKSEPRAEGKPLSPDFKSYWYAGEAELTSYRLQQARYGELREGHAVLIYVTEPFLADKQVKAEQELEGNIPVLKLNTSKKFLTGIYPYSIMTSVFYPVQDNQHAIKLSTSVQEWCGHVYTQLNNRDSFEVISHSYFQDEADRRLSLGKTWLEDELWNKLRINPGSLPVGEISLLPSLEYLRLGHKDIRAYRARATRTQGGEESVYEIEYPELQRRLRIRFETAFPHGVTGWSESYKSGFGPDSRVLTSQATRIATLKTPYWEKNGNKDVFLRDSLGI